MWLRLIAAEKLAPVEHVEPLLREANELVAIFTTSVKRLRMVATTGAISGVLLLLFSLFHFYF